MIHYSEFDFSKIKPQISMKVVKGKRYYYSNDILSFDIETTSYWIIDGTPTAYSYDYDEDFLNECDKGAVCYIWQFGINDIVVYGRTLEEFATFLKDIQKWYETSNNQKKEIEEIIIYIHNASYEFQFLVNVLKIDYVFASSPRKPYYFTSGNITFRCSYFLTNLSLEKWSEKVGVVNKQVGLLDYNVLRVPTDTLTADELKYCEFDILVMYYGLLQYKEKYKCVRKIPMTQTGETRLLLYDLFKGDKEYHELMTLTTPRNANELKRLMCAFSGGYTHTIYTNSDTIFENVGSFDLTSAYPFQLGVGKYIIEHFTEDIVFNINKHYYPNDYAYIFLLKLENVKATTSITYIPRHKCITSKGVVEDNGKILSCDECIIYFTEQDYEIIKKLYDADITFLKVWSAKKDYMNTKFRKFLLGNYGFKTSLKGVEGQEEFYLNSKGVINALYGIEVQSPINDEVVFIDNEWSVASDFSDDEYITELLQKKLNRPSRNITSYAYGVWVTAYCRRELIEMCLRINEYDETTRTCKYDDVIYCDTDSCKIKTPQRHIHKIEERNQEMRQLALQSIKGTNITREELEPKSVEGVPYHIGLWDNEGIYSKFKALGSKRYCYEDKKGKLHITVSGVSKKAVTCLKGDIRKFTNKLVFDRSENHKLLSSYLDGNNAHCRINGYDVKYNYGINMRPCNFTMSLTDEYVWLVNIAKQQGKL